MPLNPVVTTVDDRGFVTAGVWTTPIAAGVTSDTTVKGAPGRLCRVIVTAAGTGSMTIWDNQNGHTGTILAALPANPAIGSMYEFQVPAANGITVQGANTNPGVTIVYS